jgi:hypothetical protein
MASVLASTEMPPFRMPSPRPQTLRTLLGWPSGSRLRTIIFARALPKDCSSQATARSFLPTQVSDTLLTTRFTLDCVTKACAAVVPLTVRLVRSTSRLEAVSPGKLATLATQMRPPQMSMERPFWPSPATRNLRSIEALRR